MKTLRSVVAEVLHVPVESITDETAMGTVSRWDSLKHMELIMAVEDTFGLTFDGDEIATMTSVPAMEALLRAKGLTP